MYKVFFGQKVSEYVLDYFESYRKYYESLFQDSGIWSEDQIIDGYTQESFNRHIELKNVIMQKLQQENILGRKENNTLVFKWRTKYLFIEFIEKPKLQERYVTHISIR